MPVNAAETKAFADLSKSFISSSDARDRLSAALREHLAPGPKDYFWLCDDGVSEDGPMAIYNLERGSSDGDVNAPKSILGQGEYFRIPFKLEAGKYTFGEPVKVRRTTGYEVVAETPLAKSGGAFIGPKGGKWADAEHKIPWSENGGKMKLGPHDVAPGKDAAAHHEAAAGHAGSIADNLDQPDWKEEMGEHHGKVVGAYRDAEKAHKAAAEAHKAGKDDAVELSHKAQRASDDAADKNPMLKSRTGGVVPEERGFAKSLQAAHLAAAEMQPDSGAAAAHREAAGIYETTALSATAGRYNAGMAQAGRVAGLVKSWLGIPDQHRPAFAAFRKSMDAPAAVRPFAFSGSNATGDALGNLPAVVAGSRPAAEVTTPASPEPTTYSAERGAVNGMRKSMGAFYGRLAAGAARTPLNVRFPAEAAQPAGGR